MTPASTAHDPMTVAEWGVLDEEEVSAVDALLTASLLVAVSDCPGTRAAGLVLDVDALWAEVDELIAQ